MGNGEDGETEREIYKKIAHLVLWLFLFAPPPFAIDSRALRMKSPGSHLGGDRCRVSGRDPWS